jgi:hypothetical protein
MAARKKVEEVTTIAVPEIKVQTANIRISGTSSLVCHKFSEKAKKAMLDKQMKVGKTTAREAKNPVGDFIGALYWLTPMPTELNEAAFEKAVADGAKFGFPTTGIKEAICAGAYRAGLSKDKVSMYGKFHIKGEFAEIQGQIPHMREDTVKLATGVADIRHRPEFPAGWFMELEITYNSAVLSLEQLVSFVELGGFSVGIGEHRIEKGGSWGAFTVVG